MLSTVLFATDAPAAPKGGGGGGGGTCFTCSCSITGTIGGQTCYCPNTANGGSGCVFKFEWGIGTSCFVKLGPCAAAVAGFAP